MFIKLFWHTEQLSEELTSLLVLIRQKSLCCINPKCLMEEPSVESPMVTIQEKSSSVIRSRSKKTGLIGLLCVRKYSQLIEEYARMVRTI